MQAQSDYLHVKLVGQIKEDTYPCEPIILEKDQIIDKTEGNENLLANLILNKYLKVMIVNNSLFYPEFSL